MPKLPNFAALREQISSRKEESPGGMLLPASSRAPFSASQQVSPAHTEDSNNENQTSGRTNRSHECQGIFKTSSDSLNDAPPRRKGRAGNVENVQPTYTLVIETVKVTAEQAAE